MKAPTKPVSSPGRTEKYPPPLMKFVTSNVGSRSRGRSRSSPMFVRKKNTGIETQEPSSPKVTCMGQVRVGGSKQANTRLSKRKSRCKWIRNALFCRHLNGRIKPKFSRPAWSKWVVFSRAGFKGRSKTKEDSSMTDPKFDNRSKDLEQGSIEEEEEEEEDEKVYVATTISPPKNALLLTRCRSAPYRSSSFTGRFWGSPLGSEETEQKQSTEQENTEDQYPASKIESISSESDQESLFSKEFDGSITSNGERIAKGAKFEELRTEEGGTARPLNQLTRCKSVPARISEELDPEMSSWKKRRLDFT